MQTEFRQVPVWAKEKGRYGRIKAAIVLEAAVLLAVCVIFFGEEILKDNGTVEVTGDGLIKWVDFNVTYEALCRAYQYDVDTYGKDVHLDWIELLAYAAAKCGGDFGVNTVEDIRRIAEQLISGETTMEKAAADMKYYGYYKEAYTAVLGGFVGEYEIQEKEDGEFVGKYGLKAFSPVAKGFEYSDYDDDSVTAGLNMRAYPGALAAPSGLKMVCGPSGAGE